MSSKFDARQTKLVPAQAMIGSAANDTLDTVIPKINDELAKLFEDTNIVLAEGGTVSVNSTATSVTFSASLKLHVNSLVAGGSPKVIDLTSTTRAFTTDGNMLYAVIDRVTGTATVTADSATLPAVTSSNQEVVLIAKRIGTSIIFRNGVGIAADLSKTLDSATLGVNNLSVSTKAQSSVSTDTATGANATLTAPTTPIIRLTNGSLSSLDGIPAGVDGQEITLINDTGTTVTVNDNTGVTAANRFYTGLKKPLSLKDQASLLLRYSTATSRWRIIGGSGSGSGMSGAGGGELADLMYQAAIRDSFTDVVNGTTTVDISSGKTDATLHDIANELFRINYDASKTVTGTGTAMTISGAPSFTIKQGDVIVVNSEARKITALSSQTSVTIESAFSVDPSAASTCISQAIHTVDLNNFTAGGTGLAASSQFTTNIDEVMVGYADSTTLSDIIPDFGTAPVVGFDVSADGSSWSGTKTRVTSLSSSEVPVTTPTSNTNLYLRFFANKTSGAGAVNLLSYKVFFHKQIGQTSGGTYYTAFARPTSSIAQNCSIGLVSGKTRFTFTFPYTRGLNNGEASGSVLEVIANGQVVPRYVAGVTDTTQAYFVEVNDNTIEMDTDYSASGIDFQFKVQRVGIIDNNSRNTSQVALHDDLLDQSLDAQVLPAFLSAVNGAPSASQFRSDITGRASIPDLSSMLSVQMGSQRMMTQEIYQLQTEFGPAGQPVFGVVNDKFNQIRFVGAWYNNNNSYGQYIHTNTVGDYVEVVFYGTGLNINLIANNPDSWLVSINGGTETALVLPATISAILSNRNYSPNQIIPIASGLALGLHTVRIKNNNATYGIPTHGFEVLTETTSLRVMPGTVAKGKYKNVLSAMQTVAYDSNFESGVLGTKGGCVLVYLKNDGTIGKAINPTDSTALYLTNTSHANEEVVRTHYWREFGAGRSDDFSPAMPSTTNAAFTLDDGVTTLVGSSVRWHGGSFLSMGPSAANGFVTFTFIGTGLDILEQDDGTDTDTTADTVYVDGVSVGNLSTSKSTTQRITKICSGLPYGTHTVKIARPASGTVVNFGIINLIVYAPKKPALPVGAIELAQYYNVANNVVGTAGQFNIGSGLIRKVTVREMSYVGTWSTTLNVTTSVAGVELNTTASGNYVEYTFFGTGFELRGTANTNQSNNNPITLNGLAATTANFPTLTSAVYGGYAFASGVLNQNASVQLGAGLSIAGLPLAKYTVRITCNQAGTAAGLVIDSFDIISPIHAPTLNGPYVVQNTLSLGNNGFLDLRKFNKRDLVLSNQSKVSKATGITLTPTTTSTTYVPLTDMSVSHNSSTGRVKVFASSSFLNNANNQDIFIQAYVDGLPAGKPRLMGNVATNASGWQHVSFSFPLNVSIGQHKVDVYWHIDGGTGSAFQDYRELTVEDI